MSYVRGLLASVIVLAVFSLEVSSSRDDRSADVRFQLVIFCTAMYSSYAMHNHMFLSFHQMLLSELNQSGAACIGVPGWGFVGGTFGIYSYRVPD